MGGTGCSLIFVTPPPENVETLPPLAQVECTSSKVAPILDGIAGAYQLVRTGYALSLDDAAYEGQPISREVDIGFGVGLSVLFVASTVYGFKQTGKCRRAKDQHLEKQRMVSDPALESSSRLDSASQSLSFGERQSDPLLERPAPDQQSRVHSAWPLEDRASVKADVDVPARLGPAGIPVLSW